MDSDDSDNIPPGPGSYDIVKPARSNNGISFGKSRKDTSYWQIEESPGPGSYNIGDDYYRFSRGITIGGKYDMKKPNKIPGPGAYNIRDDYYRFSRGITIGGKYYMKKPNKIPGPGAYNIPKVDLVYKKAPKYSIRPALNRFCEDN